MRTRTRTNVSEWVDIAAGTRVQTNVYCSGTPASSINNITVAAAQVPVDYVEERISDQLGRNRSNPVIHRIKVVKLGGMKDVVFANSVDGRSCVSSYGPSAVVANWQAGFANYFFPFDVNSDGGVPGSWTFGSLGFSEESLKNDVMESAKAVKADLLLNLIEANQIWPSIKGLATSLPNVANNWYEIRKNIRKWSGAFLAWKFGISPILSDMMNVHRYLPKIKQDLDNVRQEKSRRYSRKAELTATCVSSEYVNGLMGNSIIQWSPQVISAPEIRYVLVVKPNTKYLTAAFQAADLFMSRFATSPASLAWEKIPFSFVVDWFVDLRGVLRKVDEAIGYSPYQIVSFTRSYSYHVANSWQGVYYSPCDGSIIHRLPTGSCECKNYERSNVSGDTFSIIPRPKFGKSQAAISAALITQQLTKVRR